MEIERYRTTGRMSQIVKHNDTVYLAGQVGTLNAPVAEQTRECLSQIEELLSEAGSTPGKILQATIWLSDMEHFQEMNAVWDDWIPDGQAPARACGEAKLAKTGFCVEIIIIAACD